MNSPDPADTFRQEARELLDQLELALLDLEQKPGQRDLIDSAFRALHTIKGSGAMFGFCEVAEFAHEFETAFDRVRKGMASSSAALIAVALKAKDHLHALIEAPATASGGEAILHALRAIVDQAGSACVPEAVPQALADTGGWHVRFRLPEDAFVTGANPFLLLEELRAMGCGTVALIDDAIPPLEALDPDACYLGWDLRLGAGASLQQIEDVFMFMRDGMDLLIEPLREPGGGEVGAAAASSPSAETLGAVASAQPVQASHGSANAASIRVPAERLDELMDRVGELVIAQAWLMQIASASDNSDLKNVAEELDRLCAGLRDTTTGIRMVQIGSLFGRFRRLVHDLSRDLGKEVEFVTSGEETELDKTVIERLADPLVHIIRNAIDHGLEGSEDRLGAGKPAKGTVRLSAVHAGAEVAISVSDDGAGLDAARIRAKAEEAGLIAPDAKIADAELYQFLFHPGFSTAREVTEVSGRGVGMDVVKRTIESLRGRIDLSTEPGHGTTATLRLPLTLAIIDGMLVRVGKGRYTIPLSAVQECVELPPAADMAGRGRNFLNIRGSLVPFLRLRELFKSDTPADAHQKVVVVGSSEDRVGLVVDQIIGNNQTVIKSLSKLHARTEIFSGATILGDGTASLILDVPQLVGFGQAMESRSHARGRAAA